MSEPVNFRNNLAQAWRDYAANAVPLSLCALLGLLCLPTVILTGPGMLLITGAAYDVRTGRKPGSGTLRRAFQGFPDNYVIGMIYAFGVLAFLPTIVGWLFAIVLLGPVFLVRAERSDLGILDSFREAMTRCFEHPGDTAQAAFAVITLNLVALFGGAVGLLVTLPLSALALLQLWEQWSGRSGGVRMEQVYDFRSSV